MQQQPIEQRYTAPLPTVAEISEQPDLLLSDHLPILFSAFWITAISWNVFDPQLPSGFHPYHESPDRMIERKARVIACLQKMIEVNKTVDLILLQESAWLDASDFDQLINLGWQIVEGPNDRKILCRVSKDFELIGGYQKNIRSHILPEISGSVFNVTQGAASRLVTIVNAHAAHENFPYQHKQVIEQVLQSEANVIIAGDFNVAIVPEHNKAEAIVTGLVPSQFREGQGAGCNWTDGAFCGGKGLKMQQIATSLLDPNTGRAADVNVVDLQSEFQKSEALGMRPCIKLGESPYASFEMQLKSKLANQDIRVLPASNAFNQKGVAICFSKSDQATYKALCNEIPGLSLDFLEADMVQIPIVSMTAAQFVMVQEWFTRRFIQEENLSVFFLFRPKPDSSPLAYNKELQSLELESQKLKDGGSETYVNTTCRRVKNELIAVSRSEHPLTAALAKIILADYYCRISEYHAGELKALKANEKKLPACIIRPTHLQYSLSYCTEVMRCLTPEILATLTIDEKNFLIDRLKGVCDKISKLVGITNNDLVELLRLYDKAVGNPADARSATMHQEQAEDIGRTIADFEEASRSFNQKPELGLHR